MTGDGRAAVCAPPHQGNVSGGSVSGRRLYARLEGSAEGVLHLCRDVSIGPGRSGNALTVLSDQHVPAGEELTLSIAGSADRLPLRVLVTATEPHLVNGSMRHRLTVTILEFCPALPEALFQPIDR